MSNYAQQHYRLSTDVELFIRILYDFGHDELPTPLVSIDNGSNFVGLSDEHFFSRNGYYTEDSIRKWFKENEACFILPKEYEVYYDE